MPPDNLLEFLVDVSNQIGVLLSYQNSAIESQWNPMGHQDVQCPENNSGLDASSGLITTQNSSPNFISSQQYYVDPIQCQETTGYIYHSQSAFPAAVPQPQADFQPECAYCQWLITTTSIKSD